MRNKFAGIMVIAGMLCGLCALPVYAAGDAEPVTAPLSPEFLRWQEQVKAGNIPAGGLIPEPVDMSHLSKNPPKLSKGTPGMDRADTLPTSYDIRNNGWLSEVRDQSPYGTCWTFAAMGAMESSYLRQGLGTSMDLSELHLAWKRAGSSRPQRATFSRTAEMPQSAQHT